MTKASSKTRFLTITTIALASIIGASAAHAQSKYGAIAYSSSTGAKGYSYNYSTRSVAQLYAQRECEQRSGRGDCRVLVWFRNACGAVATSQNGAYGSAWATDLGSAKNIALNSCRNYGGSYCTVTAWSCTDR